MKIFFDCEFTGLKKNTELISIGLVTSKGETFYAEFTDFNSEIYNDRWIRNNVLENTIHLKNPLHEMARKNIKDKNWNVVLGNKNYIKEKLIEWFKEVRRDENIELVSDVCHYDMVLFIDIFGTAFDLPEYICPCCFDINVLIAKHYNLTYEEAFDKNRESILYENKVTLEGEKHNSLYDAMVIKNIYEIL